MPIPATIPRQCPRPACTGALLAADSEGLRAGAPLWTCSEGHHGPRFIGFQR